MLLSALVCTAVCLGVCAAVCLGVCAAVYLGVVPLSALVCVPLSALVCAALCLSVCVLLSALMIRMLFCLQRHAHWVECWGAAENPNGCLESACITLCNQEGGLPMHHV